MVITMKESLRCKITPNFNDDLALAKMILELPENSLPHKNVKSITFTAVSQLGANTEINFLISYQNMLVNFNFPKIDPISWKLDKIVRKYFVHL